MAKKIKKSLPWFLILILIGLVIGIGLNLGKPEVQADTAGTSVTVGNAAPTWTVNASEDPDSTSAAPTDVGDDVYFTAQASDPNGEEWYLAICKASGAPTPATDGPPTCNGGSGNNWVVCGPYSDDHVIGATECGYTTLVGDAESQPWYGYICDKHAGEAGLCNAVEQSTNDPFKVNRGASFTVVTDAADPVNPGATVTITTTADDPDSDGSADTLDLFVCKTAGATSAGCDGGDADTWCKDEATNPETDPTCNWVMNVTKTDNVTSNQCEGAYSYYPYIFDNHGFAATSVGNKQGVQDTNTVNNVAPEVTAVLLNGGVDFQLSTEESSDNITVTGTVKDDNGCVDVDDATTADTSIYYYKLGTKVYADCDDGAEDDNNHCYALEDCVYDAGTCTGTADSDSTFTCTVAIQYHANPTDGADSTDSTWWDYTWRATLIGSDGDLSHTLESSDIEMLSFMSYDLNTASIAYGGPLAPEATSADKTTTLEATGNVGLDVNLHSAETSMCTVDFPTCTNETMAIGQQHYDFQDDAWDSMVALTTGATELELDCFKTTTTGNPATKDAHWKIKIPAAQASGSYTGENTIAGKTGEATSWE